MSSRKILRAARRLNNLPGPSYAVNNDKNISRQDCEVQWQRSPKRRKLVSNDSSVSNILVTVSNYNSDSPDRQFKNIVTSTPNNKHASPMQRCPAQNRMSKLRLNLEVDKIPSNSLKNGHVNESNQTKLNLKRQEDSEDTGEEDEEASDSRFDKFRNESTSSVESTPGNHVSAIPKNAAYQRKIISKSAQQRLKQAQLNSPYTRIKEGHSSNVNNITENNTSLFAKSVVTNNSVVTTDLSSSLNTPDDIEKLSSSYNTPVHMERLSSSYNVPVDMEKLSSSYNTPVHMERLSSSYNVPVDMEKLSSSYNTPVHMERLSSRYNTPVHMERLSSSYNSPVHVDMSSSSYNTSAHMEGFNKYSFTNHLNSIEASASEHSSLVCNADNSSKISITDEDMDMDWSPITQEKLISDIRKTREGYTMNHGLPCFNSTLINQVNQQQASSCSVNDVYIVVDTNVFLYKLQTLSTIQHIAYEDGSCPIVYVPWMVIQELDYFKDGYSPSAKCPVPKPLQERSRTAVKYINDRLLAKKPNFKGQSVRDATDNKWKPSTPDDTILASCLQLAEKNKVILLSGDTNLRNKALLSNIDAFPLEQIISELRKKPMKQKKDIIGALADELSFICSFILKNELESYYSNAVFARNRFKPFPWPLLECIKVMKENYNNLFKNTVQKQCLKVIYELYEILSSSTGVQNETKFEELSLSLLIYIRAGLPKYTENIQRTIEKIKNIDS